MTGRWTLYIIHCISQGVLSLFLTRATSISYSLLVPSLSFSLHDSYILAEALENEFETRDPHI